MQVTAYPDVTAFLRQAQPALEAEEAVHSLLLGICLRLARYPELIEAPPCFMTVGDGHGLVLAAVMTPPFHLVVSGLRGDFDAAARALAAALLAGHWPVPGVQGPAGVADLVASRLAEAAGSSLPRLVRCERLYVLSTVRRPVPAHGRLRLAAEPEAPLIARWWYDSSLAAFGQADAADSDRVARRYLAAAAVYVWDVGRPVSQAVKTSPTTTGITVARVYTPPEERGHGYATACVAELSRLLLAEGRDHCTLLVEASNVIAQRLYQRVGYLPLASYHELVLEP